MTLNQISLAAIYTAAAKHQINERASTLPPLNRLDSIHQVLTHLLPLAPMCLQNMGGSDVASVEARRGLPMNATPHQYE